MSLSGALSNAMSGLTANARGTTVIAANIANALNEGYGRRSVTLATDVNQTSGGVRVAQITRQSDPILAYQKRLAAADLSASSAFAAFDTGLEQIVGSIDTLGSIAAKLTRMETALMSAVTDPASETRLRDVSFAAEGFASALREASDGLGTLRTRADQQIVTAVDQLNSGLSQLEKLNKQIMTAKHHGQDAHGLMDQRDTILDTLSNYVPLHVVERDSGVIAVFSAQGRTLLDQNAVRFSFDPAPTVLPHMNVSNGLLSRLQINGQEIDIPGSGMMQGGALAAQFELRDTIAPQAQARLDGIARDAIERFGPGGADPTLGPGDAGVFTDSGLVFAAGNETGIASRIALNTVLGSTNAEPWRWRDGINALVPGSVGQSDLLLGLHKQILETRPAGSLALGAGGKSLVGHLQAFGSDAAANRVRSVDARDFASSHFDSVRQSVAAGGVNTDQELQNLIELEKSYAANARVVQVVDDMLSELLRI
ncbi:MAG: flagellar hook-associated protein FlgK [Marivita sp.]|uniref:flagellar hook-associated protein FlgK n=1 Tax=Marivita sp. TaxID=2003365 RepID=UPI003EF46A96